MTKQILFFSAPWCAQCPPAKSALKEGMRAIGLPTSSLTTILKVYDMEDAESAKVASGYNINGLPTIVFLEDGKPVDMFHGYSPERDAIYWEARLRHWMEV